MRPPTATPAVQLRWDEAAVFIGDYDGCLLSGAALQLALQQLP